MTRKVAAQRHVDSAPASTQWPPTGPALVEAVRSLAHPVRRRLFELLVTDGPTNVSGLTERAGLAPGSVSHHMAMLHRAGLVVPVANPDGRSSWWAAAHDAVSLDMAELDPGTVGHAIARTAERALLDDDERATRAWIAVEDHPEPGWGAAGLVQSLTVWVTADQAADLAGRLSATISQWRDDLPAPASDPSTPAGDQRRPVRVVARVLPQPRP